ncbi:Transcriptional regulator, LysR family, partial [Pseudomonas coronafaciens pv. garcae]
MADMRSLLHVTICHHFKEVPTREVLMDTLQNMRAFSCVAQAGSFTT